ncbi:hypothetical protein ACFV2N_47370 [Streptomyces sp. NPDC059680]|uniref:hypothetical protein n=1 Tax=Streptomyces sp. NPDC059680 TaxID=3346904 RepID=UPI00368695EE
MRSTRRRTGLVRFEDQQPVLAGGTVVEQQQANPFRHLGRGLPDPGDLAEALVEQVPGDQVGQLLARFVE